MSQNAIFFFGGGGEFVTVSPELVYVTMDGMKCETRIANMKNIEKFHDIYDKF